MERQLPAVLLDLLKMRTTLEDYLTDFAPGAPPVLDPFTGQPLSQLPIAVMPATRADSRSRAKRNSP